MLAKSRFTLIIPSYDITTFSIIRFVESVSHGCLPFVLDSCNIDALENDFLNFKEIIEKYLIVHNFKEIDRKISEISEKERINIIKEIQQSDDWRRINNINYLKKCWREIINA